MVVGFGDTLEDAVQDHYLNLEAFLQRCADRGIKLNSGKVQLRKQEVPFIGHVATDQGLRADPTKVHAITQMNAFHKLREAITTTPVLRYYNLEEEVTLQCDASQSGLGAALVQNGQPVAYASRALTDTETRYAQIEKELLAIVYACDKFNAYIYGRDRVMVESDH